MEEAVQKMLWQMLLGLNGHLPIQQPLGKATPVLANGHTNGHANGHTNGYKTGYTSGHTIDHDNGYTNGTTSKGVTSPVIHEISKEAEKPSTDTLPKDVSKIIYDVLSENLNMTHLTADANLFDHGLDSIQVQSLVTTPNGYLIKFKPGVELLEFKQLYDKPTVRDIIAMVE